MTVKICFLNYWDNCRDFAIGYGDTESEALRDAEREAFRKCDDYYILSYEWL